MLFTHAAEKADVEEAGRDIQNVLSSTCAQRRIVLSYSIVRQRSSNRQIFGRSPCDIRADGIDVVGLCFVRRGTLRISHGNDVTVVDAGHCLTVRSASVFTAECMPGDNSDFDVLYVALPSHALRRIVGADVATGLCLPALSRQFRLVERILIDILEAADVIPDESAERLLDGALLALRDAIGARLPPRARPSIAEQRLRDVMRYIDTHLTDSALRASTVAKACGISERYLALLLQRNGTPLSALIWGQRLEAARQRLIQSRSENTSISEIAYRLGFKSPSHFSRQFRQAFDSSPRQYRAKSSTSATRDPNAPPTVTPGPEPAMRHGVGTRPSAR